MSKVFWLFIAALIEDITTQFILLINLLVYILMYISWGYQFVGLLSFCWVLSTSLVWGLLALCYDYFKEIESNESNE